MGKFQLVFPIHEIWNFTVKFSISRNTYKIVKYYELILSVLNTQVRREKPNIENTKAKHTLSFQVDGKMYTSDPTYLNPIQWQFLQS